MKSKMTLNQIRCWTVSIATSLSFAGSLFAADITKLDTSDNLDQGAAWSGGFPPTLADRALFDSTVALGPAAGSYLLGLDTNWLGIVFTSPGTNIVIGAGNTLLLGAQGIDMSSATTNLTLQCPVFVGATQVWNVASGRALIASGAIAGTNGFIKSGAGVLGLGVANTWTNGTVISNGVVSLDATTATLGVNAIGHTLTLAGGAISNNWGTGNQVTHNNSIVVPAGTTGTIKMGNRIRLASNGNAASISGGGTLNIVCSSTVTRTDIGSQAGPFTGTVNFVNELGFVGQTGLRLFINAGAFSGFSNATVNLDGNQAWNYNCNSGGNTFTYGTLQGTNASAQLGFTSAGNFPRIVIGTLNADASLAAQFVANASVFKAGAGALTLTHNHTHALSNWVQSGRIIFVTGGSSSNASQTVVANTAGIGIRVSPNAAQWVGTNFIYGPGTNRLEFNLGGSTPSTTVAPLVVRGNLALNSSNLMVGIVGGNWSVGQFPLVKYGTLSGAPGFTAVSLTNQPAGVQGYLSNYVANASIDYVVTNSLVPLKWATGNGTWDINTTANWQNTASVTTNYQEVGSFGDSVLFEDTLSGSSPITVTLNSTVVPVSVTHNGSKNFTISGSGSINGSGSVAKQGAGTLTLATVNGFTGGLNLGGGILNFSALNNLGNSSSPINFSGGTLQYGGANTSDISAVRTVSLNAGGATIDTVANNVTYTAAIGNNGAGGLTKTGSGSLTLNGNNRYSGTTTVSQGTLTLAAGAGISNSPSIVVSSGATLDVSASGLVLNGAVSQTLSGSGTVNGTVTSGTGTSLLPGTSPGTLTLNNDLNLVGGTYVYDVSTNAGRDLIIVSGNLSLTSGTIQVNATQALTNGVYKLIQYSGGLSGAAANLILTGFSQAGKLASLSDATAGEIDLVVVTAGGSSIVWQGDGGANLWDISTSYNWLNGIVSTQYANGDFVSFTDAGSASPPVNLASSVQPGGVTVNNTAVDYIFSTTGSGRLSGSTGLTKSGTGKLTILTQDNKSGTTLINAGTIQVGDGATTGDIGGGNITNNSALVFQQTDNRSVAGAVAGTGSLAQNGATVLTLAGQLPYSGVTTIASGATLQAGNGGANGAMSTSAITNDGRLILNSSATWATASPISGAGELIKAGTGTLTLSGNNTYAGNTYISNGVVKVGAAQAIPSTGWMILDGSASVAGRLDLNGVDCTVGPLAGLGSTVSGLIVNNTGTATNVLTVNETAATTYAGTIADNTGTGGKVALTKIGAAALSLTGNNSYSGGTYVGEGTLNFGNTGAGTGRIVLTNGVTLNSLGFNGNEVSTLAGSTATVSTTASEGGNSYGGNFFSGDSLTTNSIVGPTSWGVNNVKQFQNFIGTVRIESGSSIRYSSTSLNVNGGDNTLFEVLGTLKTRNGTGNGEGIAVGALTGNGILSAGASGGTVRMNVGARGMDTEFSGQVTGTTPNTLDFRKVGTGTLTLSGSLAYDGSTTVSNGVLALTGSAELDDSPAISINSGAFLDVSGIGGTLNLGNLVAQTLSGSGTVRGSVNASGTAVATIAPGFSVGTLSVTGSVALAANTIVSMELNRTNCDKIVAGLGITAAAGATVNVTNIGTTLHSGDKFQLFNVAVTGGPVTANLPATDVTGQITYTWQNDLAADGSITVLSGLNTNAPVLTNIVSGGTLQLSWPVDHTGWTLQAQTNGINVGITPSWVTVAGSTTTNQVFVPIVPTNPTVFYRLQLPLP